MSTKTERERLGTYGVVPWLCLFLSSTLELYKVYVRTTCFSKSKFPLYITSREV
ncbi:hypothetical protein PEXP_066290 [Penicillium expansum]|nr:hypothetical protein PEXP_066290 [Penicillium expansum]